MLLAVVVGSGIMAQGLFPDSVGLALLANALATGGGLVALILTFGGISGAHFNPVIPDPATDDPALGREQMLARFRAARDTIRENLVALESELSIMRASKL